ncbi:UPF0158 family protein [Micromonospora phytophila]|uniref:UPF0158 family protein n=1 Tax=Micromonospora phytophila TaxID=709888 RepID=UPI0020308047|nr:UPF0158 family protein [Micromonospora phytophila]MCM0673482.1 UPF0158 family protein [Micromonospora phytophila]
MRADTALQDQSADEYRWLIDPVSGEIMMWTADGGIDGRTPVDLDELDLVPIEALPPSVWHCDMVDFAERVSDEQAGRRLLRAVHGRGAFRRFRDELHDEYPHLLTVWHAFHQARATRRTIDWLLDSLIDDAAASRCRTSTLTRMCRESNRPKRRRQQSRVIGPIRLLRVVRSAMRRREPAFRRSHVALDRSR